MGHMTHHAISSLEAGIILVADGCDMEKGRSRIPLLISNESRVGDIHKYSSSSVEKVTIERRYRKTNKDISRNDCISWLFPSRRSFNR